MDKQLNKSYPISERFKMSLPSTSCSCSCSTTTTSPSLRYNSYATEYLLKHRSDGTYAYAVPCQYFLLLFL